MNDVPWWHKAGVGMFGAIALSLLKLIDAQFYVQVESPVVIQAAYFTYAAYMILGALAAVFLADHDLPPRKIVRSAFVIGLLAPSLLLALISQPVRVNSQSSDPSKIIPRISFLPLSQAAAQDLSIKHYTAPKPQQEAASTSPVDFIVVPKSALEPSFADALRGVVGRGEVPVKYVYVLGRTSDKGKAASTAALVNSTLASAKLKSSVIQVAGEPQYFVTVGGFVDLESAYKLKASSTGAVAKTLAIEGPSHFTSADRSRLAEIFADAPVVTVKSLSSK